MIIDPSNIELAVKAVARLVVSVAIGYVFTKKGIITQGALTALSRLIYYVFQPALLFVQVTSTVATPGGAINQLLVLPPFALVQVFIGIIVGWVMERVVGLKPGSPESRELRMSSSFGNAGVLPFLFVEAIFSDPVEMSTARAFASFYLIGWSPTFWTIGYVLLAGKPQVAATVLPSSELKNLPSSESSSSFKVLPWFRRMMANPITKKLFAPPFIGGLAGVVVGAIPCTYKLLVKEDAPLSPILSSLEVLGRGFLPSAILVLAGSLAKAQSASNASQEETTQGSSVFYRKVTAIMIARFLIMPVVTIGLLIGGFRAGIIPVNRLLWFVLLLEGCMPPAQNSVVILQIAERPDLAGSLAKTLAAVYILSAVGPIAILLSTMLLIATDAEALWT